MAAIFAAGHRGRSTAAHLMGLDNRHVFAFGMALSLAIVGIAGLLIALRTNFDPAIGPARLIFGFAAVIIGGLGRLWGTLAGGILLGVARGVGAQFNPGRQVLAGHIALLAVHSTMEPTPKSTVALPSARFHTAWTLKRH
jgi:branched-chain amino acid transport system permease protein